MKSARTIFSSVLLIGLIAMLLSGCGKRGNAVQHDEENSADSTAVEDTSAAAEDTMAAAEDTAEVNLDLIPVEVAQVEVGDISSYLLLSSTIETENVVDVYPLVGGVIEKLFVEEGKWVEEGTPLLQLVDDEIILNEKQEEVNYDQKQLSFKRLEQMYAQNLVSDEDYETARYTLKQAEIARDKARLTRQRTTIRSPISGIISERLVQPGNLVSMSSKLFVITDPAKKICRVWVPERDLAQLAVGQKAFVTSEIALQERFPGWIKRISPVVEPTTGTCKVTVGIRDPKNRLRPGMFVRAEVVIATHENALLAPKNALVYENDLEWVYVIADSLAVKKQVQIGFSNGNRFEAIAGLNPDDQVVVVGQTTLKDSVAVNVVNLDSVITMALTEMPEEEEPAEE
jgi:RND family efflux transporter MFP subunit